LSVIISSQQNNNQHSTAVGWESGRASRP